MLPAKTGTWGTFCSLYVVMMIKEYPDEPRYRVAEDGTVFGVYGRPLVPIVTPKGYRTVNIYINKKLHVRTVHRVVLETFVGLRPDGMECCHGNGVRSDNRLENLRWDTHEANEADKVRHGTRQPVTECPAGHAYDDENVMINNRGHRECRACRRERATRRPTRSISRPGFIGPRRPRTMPIQRKTASTRKTKSACIHGHEYTEENTYVDTRLRRRCRECKRMSRAK